MVGQINTLQVADMLPSKTIPEVSNKKGHRRILNPKIKTKPTAAPPSKKARTFSVEVEEIEDEDSPRRTAARNASISPTSSFEIPDPKKASFDLIRILMLVKKRLHLARMRADTALGR